MRNKTALVLGWVWCSLLWGGLSGSATYWDAKLVHHSELQKQYASLNFPNLIFKKMDLKRDGVIEARFGCTEIFAEKK